MVQFKMIFSCGTFRFWLWRESKEEMKRGKLRVAGQNKSRFTHWWSRNEVLGQRMLLKPLRKTLENWFECHNEDNYPVPSAVENKVKRKINQESLMIIQSNDLYLVLSEVWEKKNRTRQTVLAEHKVNPPFKHYFFLAQM